MFNIGCRDVLVVVAVVIVDARSLYGHSASGFGTKKKQTLEWPAFLLDAFVGRFDFVLLSPLPFRFAVFEVAW